MKLSQFRKQQRAKKMAKKGRQPKQQNKLSALAIPPKTMDPLSLVVIGCPVHPLDFELSAAMDAKDHELVTQLRSQLDKELQTQFQERNQMVKLSDYTGSKFLKAKDVDPPLLLTIAGSEVVELGKDKEEKVALRFKEIEKSLVLNTTNSDTLERISGKDDSVDMVGLAIVVFKDETDFGGRRVDCIRVRAPKKKSAEYAEPSADGKDPIPF